MKTEIDKTDYRTGGRQMILTSVWNESWFYIVIWIAVFVIALIVELATEQLISIWFAGSALIALLLAVLDVHWAIQLIVFVIVAAIAVGITQYLMVKKKNNVELRTNADAMLGEKIAVLEKVGPEQLGEGKFRDVVWSLKSDQVIEKGEYAKIVRIDGNKLIVEKVVEESQENERKE